MNIQYIIVQAGGKGTRLGHLTKNKPKALAPVSNLPMLFHLFRKFPDKRFIIIGDYKREVLKKYLEEFAEVSYLFVEAEGSGTCGGIKQAIQLLPPEEPLMLIWSDLVLADGFRLPESDGNYVGISKTFPCRWSYRDGRFAEERSEEYGVAGLFVFENAMNLRDVPREGELVRWLQGAGIHFKPLPLNGTREFGTLAEYEKLSKDRTRPFNKLTFCGGTVVKEPVDAQGERLAKDEENWYRFAAEHGVACIPAVSSFSPIRMERIDGENIYELDGLSFEKKAEILSGLVSVLKGLHQLHRTWADPFSLYEAYVRKTWKRISRIRDMVPYADRKSIIVNGRECRNVFYYRREFEDRVSALHCDNFCLIHGDCTFSNMLLDRKGSVKLIDPRGYFGYTKLFGDPNYDWAKLYYSIVGNYDQFNLKKFRLEIKEGGVSLEIVPNGWDDMEDTFFRLTETDPAEIKLLHALIWLSLTTYAWQDYDSICGAFYNGLFYLEEVLSSL